MQISFVMQIFLLFLGQISVGERSLRGQTASAGAPPAPPPRGRKPDDIFWLIMYFYSTMNDIKLKVYYVKLFE